MSSHLGPSTRRTHMLDRRSLISICSRFGLATTLFPGVLWALAQKEAEQKSSEQKTDQKTQEKPGQKAAAKKPAITRDMIDKAAAIAGVHILDEYKDMILIPSMGTSKVTTLSMPCTFPIRSRPRWSLIPCRRA